MDKKFLVIGCCGAGKSTLAKKMQERTGLPLIHLDHEYYRPGWVKPKKAEWEEKVRQLCLKEAFDCQLEWLYQWGEQCEKYKQN